MTFFNKNFENAIRVKCKQKKKKKKGGGGSILARGWPNHRAPHLNNTPTIVLFFVFLLIFLNFII
jgi:hypothetical protein